MKDDQETSMAVIQRVMEVWPDATLVAGRRARLGAGKFPWDSDFEVLSDPSLTQSHRLQHCVECGKNFSVRNIRSRAFARCQLCAPGDFWGMK